MNKPELIHHGACPSGRPDSENNQYFDIFTAFLACSNLADGQNMLSALGTYSTLVSEKINRVEAEIAVMSGFRPLAQAKQQEGFISKLWTSAQEKVWRVKDQLDGNATVEEVSAMNYFREALKFYITKNSKEPMVVAARYITDPYASAAQIFRMVELPRQMKPTPMRFHSDPEVDAQMYAGALGCITTVAIFEEADRIKSGIPDYDRDPANYGPEEGYDTPEGWTPKPIELDIEIDEDDGEPA